MNDLKVTIKPLEKYELFIKGESIGEFQKESSWHGFSRMVGANGEVIVADKDNSLIDRIFSGILDNGEEKQLTIIAISPNLIPAGE